jgi:hypothetical protein
MQVLSLGGQGENFAPKMRSASCGTAISVGIVSDEPCCSAFAERILPRASDLWVQASLDYKQRLQQLFFPEGIAFDGIDSIEPPQRHHFSSTWRRLRVLMKRW